MIDHTKIEEAVQWCRTVAEKMYEGGMKDTPPPSAVIFFEKSGQWEKEVIIFPEFGDERFDDMNLLGFMQAAAFRDVKLMVLTTEIWRAEIKIEEYNRKDYKLPSERPDRVEALMVSAMSRDKYTVLYTYPIFRDQEGVGTLGPPEVLKGIQPGSIMAAFWKGYEKARWLSGPLSGPLFNRG